MLELIFGAGIFAADQKIKKYMENGGAPKKHRLISFVLHHNYGMTANMGSGKPLIVKVLSVLLTVIICMIYVITLTTAGHNVLRAGLAILLGGAFSNTYDRLKNGYVTDYLKFEFGPRVLRKLIWNVADFAIIIGSLISVLSE